MLTVNLSIPEDQRVGRAHVVANHDAERVRDDLGDADQARTQALGRQLPHAFSRDEEVQPLVGQSVWCCAA